MTVNNNFSWAQYMTFSLKLESHETDYPDSGIAPTDRRYYIRYIEI